MSSRRRLREGALLSPSQFPTSDRATLRPSMPRGNRHDPPTQRPLVFHPRVVGPIENDPDRHNWFVADRPEPMRVVRIERQRVAGAELVGFEAELKAEASGDDIGIFDAAMTEEGIGRTGGGAHLVDDVNELDLVVGPGGQALPANAAGQAYALTVPAALNRAAGALDGELRSAFKSDLAGGAFNAFEQIVDE